LIFNRPDQRNAMSVDMMAEFHGHLAEMDADPAVRCIVLEGAGGHFVAGGDIKSWDRLRTMTPDQRGEDFRRRLDAVQPLIELLDTLSKPLIAAVRGFAAGAGLCFVAAADFVVADETATFLFANVRTSLVPDMGLTTFLPRAIGARQAARLCLLSDKLDAREAERLGLVTDLVSSAEFDDAVASLVAKLTALPRTALSETRRLMRQTDGDLLRRRYAAEQDGLAACAATDDFLEAVTAFLERRKPRFGP
jgi:2-(1,2-epoxy-1,2-dihydrophenyl)acetyl-CoA isomerase